MKNPTDNLSNNMNELRATLESARAFATAVCTEMQRLQKENEDLRGWVAGVEADNATLRNEIARLRESETLVARTVRENREKILSRGWKKENSSFGADLILMKRRNYKGDLELQRLANDAMTRH
jgi:regulator of replication initiation timing